jgi:hypothetical protein
MSHTVVLKKNQMAFFIYNLFGHDIAHDGHPSGLGEARFANVIQRSLSVTSNSVMNQNGRGSKSQIGGSKSQMGGSRESREDETKYFNEIGQMSSRDTILYSVARNLIENGKLYVSKISRTDNSRTDNPEKKWQDNSIIIIDIQSIIDNKRGMTSAIVYVNNEVIYPYEIIIHVEITGLGGIGKKYTLEFRGKVYSIQFIISNTGLLKSIMLTLQNEIVVYDQITLDKFNSVREFLSDEFYYDTFSDYMKTTSLLKIEGPSLYFSDFFLKFTSPVEKVAKFFKSIIEFYNFIKQLHDNRPNFFTSNHEKIKSLIEARITNFQNDANKREELYMTQVKKEYSLEIQSIYKQLIESNGNTQMSNFLKEKEASISESLSKFIAANTDAINQKIIVQTNALAKEVNSSDIQLRADKLIGQAQERNPENGQTKFDSRLSEYSPYTRNGKQQALILVKQSYYQEAEQEILQASKTQATTDVYEEILKEVKKPYIKEAKKAIRSEFYKKTLETVIQMIPPEIDTFFKGNGSSVLATREATKDIIELIDKEFLNIYSEKKNLGLAFRSMVQLYYEYEEYIDEWYTTSFLPLHKIDGKGYIEYKTQSEIFLGHIKQMTTAYKDFKPDSIFKTINIICDDSLNNILEMLKTVIPEDFKDECDRLINLFVISNMISGSDDGKEDDDDDDKEGGSASNRYKKNIMSGGAKLPYESSVVQPQFINGILAPFASVRPEFILDKGNIPTVNENIKTVIATVGGELILLQELLLPRVSLPEKFGQLLYGPVSARSTTLNLKNLLSFVISKIPSELEINCLTELNGYKKSLYNEPEAKTNIKEFVDDLIKLLEDIPNLGSNAIIYLLMSYKFENKEIKILPIFVNNVTGSATLKGEKSDLKRQLGVIYEFEQNMIRQIRIAIFFLLTRGFYDYTQLITPDTINKYLDTFLQSLLVYSKILNIITKLFESAPGLTTIQRVNSAYMISSAVLAVKYCMKKIEVSEDTLLDTQVKILSSIYLKKNVSKGSTGVGDIDEKLFTEFKKWISTGPKGAGNFVGNAGYFLNEKIKYDETSNLLDVLGIPLQGVTDDMLFYINNAVNAKTGLPKFFCPLSSIADAQVTCNTLESALKKNGVEFGTMDVIIRDGNVNGRTTGETMRYHIRLEQIGTPIISISAFLKIGNAVLVNIGHLSSTPSDISADPPIVVDLNSKRSPLEASSCLKEIISANVDTLASSPSTVKSWDEYLASIESDSVEEIISTRNGTKITPQNLRRKIISASFRKSLGDFLQELNMVIENGGYIDKIAFYPVTGTTILEPNQLRLGLSNDRPAAIRALLLLLFGQSGINENSIAGFINNEGKYFIGIKNKKKGGGKHIIKLIKKKNNLKTKKNTNLKTKIHKKVLKTKTRKTHNRLRSKRVKIIRRKIHKGLRTKRIKHIK